MSLGIKVVYVKWFSWPWEIFESSPHVQFERDLSGYELGIITLSALTLSLLWVILTIYILNRFWGAKDWGIILLPLTISSIFYDVGGGLPGILILALSLIILIILTNAVVANEIRRISREGHAGSDKVEVN